MIFICSILKRLGEVSIKFLMVLSNELESYRLICLVTSARLIDVMDFGLTLLQYSIKAVFLEQFWHTKAWIILQFLTFSRWH